MVGYSLIIVFVKKKLLKSDYLFWIRLPMLNQITYVESDYLCSIRLPMLNQITYVEC